MKQARRRRTTSTYALAKKTANITLRRE